MKDFFLRLWDFRQIIILVLTPLVFLPVIFLLPRQEGKCLYIILIMATYWCTEALPLAITALLPISLFPLFGILPSSKTCPLYFLDTNALFFGGLVMAVMIEEWNLHRRVALRILKWLGVNPFMLILGLMLTTSLLSMWLSNTATTTMMLPIATAVLGRLHGDSGKMQQNGTEKTEEPQEKELSAEETNEEAAEEREGEVQELEIEAPPHSTGNKFPYDENFAKGMLISIPYAATIGGISTLTGTPPNLVLDGQMKSLFPNSDELSFGSWFMFALPLYLIFLIIAWIWISLLYGGLNPRSLMKKKNKEEEKRMRAVILSEYRLLGPMTFAEISVCMFFGLFVILLLTRDPKFVTGWASAFRRRYVSDAVVVITIIILTFIFPSRKPSFKWKTSPEEPNIPNRPLLTWDKVQHKVAWNVILLLGGGFAIAKACEESGLSRWIGNKLRPLEYVSPSITALAITLIIAAFTEFASNTASSVIFLPILAELAFDGKQNPLYIMVPGTVACSFAFMLPVATAPNAIAFSSGQLKVKDMVKAGIMMNIIGIVLINTALNTWGRLIFKFSTFPKWAETYMNDTNRAAMNIIQVIMTTSD
ncbi:Na(+)/dicarboxylate cotransporter 3-like [Scyliorhinus torazame]|uniref:Na(+)/dicarboxylate cotransporter 3-like n=1 Tax=Scyliorhinus torazame TaxID=75743 RepID=UPI003B58D737